MSALHRSWLADQADAIKYQREMRELDTYANPYRGDAGVAMASGFGGRAMGADGNALFLVFRADDGSIKHAQAAIVGQGGIKAGIWYSLDADGNFVEVEP